MDGKRGRGGDDPSPDASASASGGWLERMIVGLEAETEALLHTMAAQDPPTDILAIDRKAKAIANVARAVRAIEAIRPRSRTGGRADTAEDTMNDDDDADVDPAEFERAQAELGHRLEALRRTVEIKRMEGWPLVSADAGGKPQGEPAVASADP